MSRIPIPRTERLLRLALVGAAVISALFWTALWLAGGPAAVLIPIGCGALGMLAIGLWMHRYPGGDA